MTFDLRPYQLESITGVRNMFARGVKKGLLHLPTGAGKTEIFIKIVSLMLPRNKRCWVVTRGRELCFNAKDRFEKRGIKCSMLMGNESFDASCLTTIVSIDTWLKRHERLGIEPDLIVIDEAHFAGSPQFEQLSTVYPNAYYLAVTATPWPTKSIRHVAEEWLAPVDHATLVSQGFLLPAKVFVPFTPKLSGVRVKAGEYVDEDLMDVLGQGKIYGDIAKHYVQIAKKSPAFCFCINVKHSVEMADYFNGLGIRAQHVDAETCKDDREAAILRLKAGDLDVVTNCNILSTGVDVPSIRAILSCRPTKSRILWVQQAGRGTRLHPGKEFFYLMDHGNNIQENGFIETYQEPTLDGRPKGKSKKVQTIATYSCKTCFGIFAEPFLNCPQCGAIRTQRNADIKTDEKAELQEVNALTYAQRTIPAKDWFEVMSTVTRAYINGYKRQYIFVKLKDTFDERRAKQYSSRAVVDAITRTIDEDQVLQGLEKPRGFG